MRLGRMKTCPRAAALLVVLMILAFAVRAEEAAPTAPNLARTPVASPNDVPFPVDHDAPLNATEKADRITEDYTRLRVEFNGIRKDRVPAYLYLPKGSGGGFHAVND